MRFDGYNITGWLFLLMEDFTYKFLRYAFLLLGFRKCPKWNAVSGKFVSEF